MRVAFYDTKGYDRDYFKAPADISGLDLVFHDFRLCTDNALSADGAEAASSASLHAARHLTRPHHGGGGDGSGGGRRDGHSGQFDS